MGRPIFGMHWGVVKFSNYKHGLLTSDRPIASNIFRIGGNHLCLPISPEMVFIACDTPQTERESQRLRSDRVMAAMNDMIVRQARTFVYGTNDLQLRFIENWLGKKTGPTGPYLV